MRSLFQFSIVLAVLTLVFTVSCSDKSDEESTAESLTIAPESYDFGADGGSVEVTVSSNTSYEVIFNAAWFSIGGQGKIGSYKGNTSLNITAGINTAEENREAVISLETEGGIKKSILISQEGKEPVVVEEVPDHIDPDPTGISDLGSVAFAKQMTFGWNIGNSLDAIGGETAWGNPLVSKQLIDSVKKAGFNTVRIPVAWSKFSDSENFTIEESWMNRVKQVVDHVVDNDMYAIINIHWDEGWMQPTAAEQDYVNDRLAVMWKQIAKHFRDYDDHLLFAGTNEVHVEGDYGTPSNENVVAQNSFNQTFVNTVRATGGRNSYRYLVVQGYNTNIDHTVNFVTIPQDEAADRLMMEVHYYDPYNFTLNEDDTIWQWGKDITDEAHGETWANEAWVDQQFGKMKTNFIDQGMAVILGEYGAISRLSVEGHEAYRKYYLEYVTGAAIAHGLVPVYWDNGYLGDHSMALFNRSTGEVAYPEILEAIISAGE